MDLALWPNIGFVLFSVIGLLWSHYYPGYRKGPFGAVLMAIWALSLGLEADDLPWFATTLEFANALMPIGLLLMSRAGYERARDLERQSTRQN